MACISVCVTLEKQTHGYLLRVVSDERLSAPFERVWMKVSTTPLGVDGTWSLATAGALPYPVTVPSAHMDLGTGLRLLQSPAPASPVPRRQRRPDGRNAFQYIKRKGHRRKLRKNTKIKP